MKSKTCFTLIKQSGHLRKLENVENTHLQLVFSAFPMCSQMPIVFYCSVIQMYMA